MKKLLVLILVLGLCSTANALLTDLDIYEDGSDPGATITVVTGATTSVEMYSGNTNSGIAYLGFEDNSMYSLANAQMTTNAGDEAAGWLYYPASYGYNVYWLTVASFAGNPVSGVQFIVDFTAGSVTGTVDVYLMNEALTTLDTATINIVPEPMTIALLGLGGLFLRRRR